MKSKVLAQWGVKVKAGDDFSFNKNRQSDNQLDFEKVIRRMGRLNPKIKLIVELQD